MKQTIVPVVFRMDKNGLTAVLPTIPADYSGNDMTAYVRVGQHCSCSFAWYRKTKPAKPEEYESLLTELRSIYEELNKVENVVLKVCSKISNAHHRARRAATDETNG